MKTPPSPARFLRRTVAVLTILSASAAGVRAGLFLSDETAESRYTSDEPTATSARSDAFDEPAFFRGDFAENILRGYSIFNLLAARNCTWALDVSRYTDPAESKNTDTSDVSLGGVGMTDVVRPFQLGQLGINSYIASTVGTPKIGFKTSAAANVAYNWNGGSHNSDYWSDSDNWYYTTTPSTGSNVDIYISYQNWNYDSHYDYGGTTGPSNYAWFDSITFDNTLAHYMHLYDASNQGMNLFGGIYNNSTQGVDVDVNVQFANDGTIAANGSQLIFNYETIYLNGHNVQFTGSNFIQVNDPIVGNGSSATTGGSVTINTTNVVDFTSANTYSGGTTVTAGTLRVSGSGTFGVSSGTLTVNGGTVDLNNTGQSPGTQNVGALNGTGGTILNNGSGSIESYLTVGNGDATGSYAGTIANGNGLVGIVKTGSGTQTLTGSNTYSGGTTVSAGTLLVNNTSGSGTGSGSVSVSGGTLAGSGNTFDGTAGHGSVTVSSGATLSPGTSGDGTTTTATFKTGALTLNSGSNFAVNLYGTTPGSGYDQVSVNGSLSISGSNLNLTANQVFATGTTFYIALNDGTDPVTGLFAQGASVTDNQGQLFTILYDANGDGGTLGNDIALVATPIPEPSTWVAGSLALAVIGYQLTVIRRRRLIGRSQA